MKVISGKYKGRLLDGFDISGTRPTMDRVKESLFAMIQDKMDNSIVLDLFSGSGNLGIEALSEGALFAYFVDENKKAIQVIRRNLEKLKISSFDITSCDYQKALSYYFEQSIFFDIIFLDPPYQTDYIQRSLALIDQYSLLKKDGIVVCESDSLEKIVYPNVFFPVKEKKYGDKYVVILKKV